MLSRPYGIRKRSRMWLGYWPPRTTPHINYHVFKKLIKDGACYHPKHTGPAPIYLALKKLEKEGKLKKVS
jgi:hypothetical protein